MNAQVVFFGTLMLKLTLIYLGVVWIVQVARRSIDESRLQRALGARRPVPAMLVATGFGALVPFCSCSTVPMVAAMHRAGVAMPAVTSFLIMSPLVNPATLAVLGAVASPAYALIYLLGSAGVALVVGATVGTRAWPTSATAPASSELGAGIDPWSERLRGAMADAWSEYRRVFPMLLVAGAVAATLHDEVVEDWVRSTLAGGSLWLVPVAAVVGVPIYASTAVLFPLGTALVEAGVGLGVVSALLMGATGLSIPEGIMLGRVLGVRYVVALVPAFLVGVVGVAYGIVAWEHWLG